MFSWRNLDLLSIFKKDESSLRAIILFRFFVDWHAKFIWLFMPIFLFLQTPSNLITQYLPAGLTNTQVALISMGIFFAVLHLSQFFSLIELGKLTIKLGTKLSVVLTAILMIVFYLILIFANNYEFIFLAAIIGGIWQAWNWLLVDILVSNSVAASRPALPADLRLISFLPQLLLTAAPVSGAAVAWFFGFKQLFWLAIPLAVATLGLVMYLPTEKKLLNLPLVKILLTKFAKQPNWHGWRDWIFSSQARNNLISSFGRSTNNVALLVWPLYVFFLLASVYKVGIIYSISLFLALAIVFLVGIYIENKHQPGKTFLLSGGLITAIWLIRTQPLGIVGIIFTDTFGKLFGSMHWLQHDVFFLLKNKNTMRNRVYNQMSMEICNIFLWVFLILLFYLAISWQVIFGIAAVGIIISLLWVAKFGSSYER